MTKRVEKCTLEQTSLHFLRYRLQRTSAFKGAEKVNPGDAMRAKWNRSRARDITCVPPYPESWENASHQVRRLEFPSRKIVFVIQLTPSRRDNHSRHLPFPTDASREFECFRDAKRGLPEVLAGGKNRCARVRLASAKETDREQVDKRGICVAHIHVRDGAGGGGGRIFALVESPARRKEFGVCSGHSWK